MYGVLIVASGFAIMNSYNKWESVQIISIKEDHPSITSDIPFPAITLCPTTKFNNELFEFSKKFYDAYNDNFLEEEE